MLKLQKVQYQSPTMQPTCWLEYEGFFASPSNAVEFARLESKREDREGYRFRIVRVMVEFKNV